MRKRILFTALAAALTLAFAASAQAAYLSLGTANLSNATTTLVGNTSGPELWVKNTDGATPSAFPLYGLLTATSPTVTSAAVRGSNSSTNAHGYGVWGSQAGAGIGVYGSTAAGTGVLGSHTSTSGAGPGVEGLSSASTAPAVYGVNSSTGASGYGVRGQQNGYGVGVYGLAAGTSATPTTGQGVLGRLGTTSGLGAAPAGVWGDARYAQGVRGSSYSNSGVLGVSSQGVGIYGASSSNEGVYGNSGGAFPGVYGISGQADGVEGHAQTFGKAGVYGQNGVQGGYGVFGQDDGTQGVGVNGKAYGSNGIGVEGLTNTYEGVAGIVEGVSGGTGVYGEGDNSSGYGVHGTSGSGMGVRGDSDNYQGVSGSSVHNAGVYGETTNDGFAAYFNGSDEQHGTLNVYGNANITGTLTAQTKNFRIDDPLDPAHRYLVHASVESSQLMNVYSGNVRTDGGGYATVRLPRWFEALNGDFRYQLTPIGRFAQAIVSRRIAGNRFTIRTDKPKIEVSWQVTAVRHDPYARAHPLVAERSKPASEQGTYLSPRLYGKPAKLGLAYRAAAPMRRHR
jgi:hypothetical protein